MMQFGVGKFKRVNSDELPMLPMLAALPMETVEVKKDEQKKDDSFVLPPDFKQLILWAPSEDDLKKHPETKLCAIEVEPFIARWLRPHQRAGVQFMAECVLNQRDFDGSGAILADDMGLGKTLQSVTLLYTLLRHGFTEGEPVCTKSIICCPTSLVRTA